ncbi:6775_t:CDS:2, partial [Entrophospora sp. SA101]
ILFTLSATLKRINSLPILVEINDQIDPILKFDEYSFRQSMNENLSMSEINEDDEDNQEEYDKESPEEFDKVTTMEGNFPQCVRYIVQIIGWINNGASSDDIKNAKNILLNLLIQVFNNFNTEFLDQLRSIWSLSFINIANKFESKNSFKEVNSEFVYKVIS